MKDLTLWLAVGGGLIVIAIMVWQGHQQRTALQSYVTGLGVSDPVWLRQNACIGGPPATLPATLYVMEEGEILTLVKADIRAAIVDLKEGESHVESSHVDLTLSTGQTIILGFMGDGAEMALQKLKRAGLVD